MTAWTNRAYRGDDRKPVIDLLFASRTAATIADFPTVTDMRELLDQTATELQANLRVWHAANGQLIGYGMVQMPYGNLLFDALPLDARNALVDEIVAWAITRSQAIKRDGGKLDALDAHARDDDAERVALLERHGFVEGIGYVLTMQRALDHPLTEPALPQGWTLRPLAGPDEVPAYVTLHQAAFGTTNMTVEHRMAILRDPDYRQDLDLLAVAPDGTLAAFCVCSFAPEQNARSGRTVGEISIIGTRPDLKDRGLGRTMLLAGLWRLQACGADVVTLGVSSANVIARHLYESTGFTTAAIRRWYSRPLER